jgi:hypothetical protein
MSTKCPACGGNGEIMGRPLFLIKRKIGASPGEACSMVVAAVVSQQARGIAAESHGDERPSEWVNTKFSTCRRIAKDSIYYKSQVIVRDLYEEG